MKRELAFEVSAKSVCDEIEYLCKEYPARFAGSSDDNGAAEHVAQELKKMGLAVATDDFRVPCFEEIESNLRIFLPYSTRKTIIPCMAQWFSPSTHSGDVIGELVYVGYGDEKGYKDKDVDGKIAIFRRSPEVWLPIANEMSIASRKGAKALIMINDRPWCFRGSIETGYFDVKKRLAKEPSIPTVCISSTDGDNIMNILQEQSLKACLRVNVEIREKNVRYVRGVLRGQKFPEERIVVIAHRDTVGVPGANDNASGTAIILELARVLSKYEPKRTMEFISTSGEEMFSLGASAFVQKYRDELKNIIGLINVDMVGFPRGPPRVVTDAKFPDLKLLYSDWINQLLLKSANSMGYVMEAVFGGFGASDEAHFMNAGVDAACVWKDHAPQFHTYLDTPNRLCPNDLKSIADIVVVALWEMANEDISKTAKSSR